MGHENQKQMAVWDLLDQESDDLTPEQNLCCAILTRAVNDLTQYEADHPFYESAKSWILDRSYTVFSFDYVLDFASRTEERRRGIDVLVTKMVSTKH
jgi:hypothetical protein